MAQLVLNEASAAAVNEGGFKHSHEVLVLWAVGCSVFGLH